MATLLFNFKNSFWLLLCFSCFFLHAQDSLSTKFQKVSYIGINLSMPIFNYLTNGYGAELANYYFFSAKPQHNLKSIGVYASLGIAKMFRNNRQAYESFGGHMKVGLVVAPLTNENTNNQTWLGAGVYTALLNEKSEMIILNTYWQDTITNTHQLNNLLLGGEIWINQLLYLKKWGYIGLKATALAFYPVQNSIFPSEAVSGAGFTLLGENGLPLMGVNFQIWYVRCLYCNPKK
jgi:hypothetical protein